MTSNSFVEEYYFVTGSVEQCVVVMLSHC